MRLFTLDFDGLMLYYAHSEASKRVSIPIMIRSIVKVEAMTYKHEVTAVPAESFLDFDEPDVNDRRNESPLLTRSNSDTSVASTLSSSFASTLSRTSVFRSMGFGRVEQFGLVIHYLPEAAGQELPGPKVMELLCTSKIEALRWITALTAAMQLERNKRDRAA